MIPISFADEGTYQIEADGKTFDVQYSLDGEIIAMDVDQESTSLLIGTTNVHNTVLSVSFPSELLAAQDAQFIILADGLETDYTVTYEENNPTITIPIPEATEEIEIIGTSVVPEFPFGVLAIMGIVSVIGLVITKSRLTIFK